MRLFWLVVLIPLLLVAFLAYRLSHDQKELEQAEVQRLLEGRLADVRSRAGQAIGRLERRFLDRLAESPSSFEGLRALTGEEPLARQVFLMDAEGNLVFPAERDDASRDEREFLRRTEAIWSGDAVLFRVGGDESGGAPPPPAADTPGGDSLVDLAARTDHGWLSWYWAEGLHLLFWRRTPAGGVVGLEVERIGLVARVVAALPTTELGEGRMVLVDSRGETVHQWGPLEIEPGDRAAASLAMAHPLDAWRLDYYISPSQERAFAGGLDLGLLLGVSAVGIGFLGLAVYAWREYARRLRDAAQRVSFVTQVSHELKTPLTNIRIYAELLEDQLPEEEDQDNRRRAEVIVSECQRLTRLINNILAFGRHRRGQLALQPAWIELDPVIEGVALQFGPALEARGIELDVSLAAARRVRADPDAVGQIVSNLLSNVDKYAADGGFASVSTEERGDRTAVIVCDRGPGIPAEQREAIFRPFFRLSDRLADGVTGTGIGLTIARELARSFGGELVYVERETGACFELVVDNREEPEA